MSSVRARVGKAGAGVRGGGEGRGPRCPTPLRVGEGLAGCRGGGGGRGLSPHSGLVRWRCEPGGSRTQGCEQHGPPQDEVPLRREGRRSGPVAAVASRGHQGGQSRGWASSRPLWASVSPQPGSPDIS